jgi:hypothetical protein
MHAENAERSSAVAGQRTGRKRPSRTCSGARSTSLAVAMTNTLRGSASHSSDPTTRLVAPPSVRGGGLCRTASYSEVEYAFAVVAI